MDFGFHDDVLSLVFNIGTVFVSESIRNFKSTYTSERCETIQAKSVEQTVLETLDHNVLLETATSAEIILDSYNSDNLLNSVANFESTLDNLCIKTNDFQETTAEEVITINDNDNVLLEINKDIELKIDQDSVLLEIPVDDENNTCDIYENILIHAPVKITPNLYNDNKEELLHGIGDAKPTLIPRVKEVLLDVRELMDNIKDKNVFLDDTPVQISHSKISKKTESLKRFIRKFKIGNAKQSTEPIRTISSGRLKSKLGIPQSRQNGF
ncbi:hypothetical protein CDAR_464831 [Caerostris darwini]|uniref:Uncharacterized protein n=1 Tax=Caerostris darwini TaxID=1538125 RepID=A0AAV4QM71_9ARAC|nr:hypothetical protein CDAR_464831 [Caerostris darwini]